ncbi:MAG: Lysine--tRNA ligase [candidate division WS6 bacterium OLB20]|uniref:Lysine--tRNA ligase n=1 Tax=candidate division WS6 bacterium OLB20 TaxID=1617426 RepID=A0A136M0M1_9BACT|nr:MAG: Lysine--tRNA ligase [candidate division WS6 bacterium OLB20]
MLLTKSIRPLPSKWHGITDKEERFRRRYLDMTMNKEVLERFKRRALFWKAHRDFLDSRGFHEVNIPVLEHIPGGGDAVPFVTHMNAIDEDFYLRISHELPLKRLIGGGFEKVYDIGARFRNEGLSDEHLPEHQAMEFYWAYADWKDGMELIRELFTYILDTVYEGRRTFTIRGHQVDFSNDWEIIDFAGIMRDKYGIEDIYRPDLEQLKKLLTDNGIEFDPETVNSARATDSLWKKLRKDISGPAFLINHPKFLSPLQKPSEQNPLMVERFQPIIAGSELVTAGVRSMTRLTSISALLSRCTCVNQVMTRRSGSTLIMSRCLNTVWHRHSDTVTANVYSGFWKT